MVGQRVLVPSIWVQLLVPEPKKHVSSSFDGTFSLASATIKIQYLVHDQNFL